MKETGVSCMNVTFKKKNLITKLCCYLTGV